MRAQKQVFNAVYFTTSFQNTFPNGPSTLVGASLVLYYILFPFLFLVIPMCLTLAIIEFFNSSYHI